MPKITWPNYKRSGIWVDSPPPFFFSKFPHFPVFFLATSLSVNCGQGCISFLFEKLPKFCKILKHRGHVFLDLQRISKYCKICNAILCWFGWTLLSYKINHLEYQYCTMEADPGPPKIWLCELFCWEIGKIKSCNIWNSIPNIDFQMLGSTHFVPLQFWVLNQEEAGGPVRSLLLDKTDSPLYFQQKVGWRS